MQDGYSFHADEASLDQTYNRYEMAYHAILKRCGIEYRAVVGDNGDGWQRFERIFGIVGDRRRADLLLDRKRLCRQLEISNQSIHRQKSHETYLELQKVVQDEPLTLEELAQAYETDLQNRSSIFITRWRASHYGVITRRSQPHETKVKHYLAADQVKVLTVEEAESYLTSETQLRSPIALADSIQLYADQHVQDMANLIVPAAEKQSYYLNANVGRDFQPLALPICLFKKVILPQMEKEP